MVNLSCAAKKSACAACATWCDLKEKSKKQRRKDKDGKRDAFSGLLAHCPSSYLLETRGSSARADIEERSKCDQRSAAKTEGEIVHRELNVLVLIKGIERYVFVYDDASCRQLIDLFRDQAADPSLGLTWFDATVLTQKAREQARAACETLPSARTCK
jgi:hypothetical protein